MTSFSGKNWSNCEAVSPSNYPAYPEYKDSRFAWLGELPAHWDAPQVRRVFRIQNGATPKGDNDEFWGGGIPWVTPDDLGRLSGLFISSTKRTLTEEGYASCGATLVPYRSLVMSIRAPVGYVAITENAVCTNQGCRSLVPIAEVDSRYYCYHILSCSGFLQAFSGGSTFQELSAETLAAFYIAKPSFEEQKQIADFLDHETARIDALIEEQQRLIELLQEKRQAVISHAVTKGLDPDVPMKDSGVEWLGEVPEHWSVGYLKRYWDVIDCKHVTAEFEDDGYPLASISEVQGRHVDLSKANRTSHSFYLSLTEGERQPVPEDLIFSRNATVGEIAEVPEGLGDFAMGQDVCLFRKKAARASSSFIYFVVHSEPFIHQINSVMLGATFNRLNVEQIKSVVVPMPPFSEQREIALYLDSHRNEMETLVKNAERSIELLLERRSALISAAVTGKIDVRNWQSHSSEQSPELPKVAEQEASYG